MITSLKAFVIMPFDPEFTPIYEDLIKPALEDAGYEVTRADSFLDQQNILKDIVHGLARADLIVADLTTVNANVFYELGLCHGLKIPTVLMAQSMDEVPFDLRSYRIQLYDTRFDKVHKLKRDLKDIGDRHRNNDITFGSPIIDFFPSGKLLTEKAELKNAANNEGASVEPAEAEQIEVAFEPSEEKGVLDYSADIERAFEVLAEIMDVIRVENEKISSKAITHTNHFNQLNANPTPGSAAQKQKVGLLMASDMNLCSKRFEEQLPRFENAVRGLEDDFNGLMALAMRGQIDDRETVLNSRQQLAQFLQNADLAISSFSNLRDAVAGLTGISKDVNRASRRLADALTGIVQNMERIKAFAVRAIALVDQWLDGTGANLK